MSGPLAGAGGPRRAREGVAASRRVGSWLVWWVLLMGFWVWVDDSVLLAELVVGAIVAAIGASLVEVAQYQAATHVRVRVEWLVPALALPGQVLRGTFVVFAALWRTLVGGEQPPSCFEERPVRWGDGDAGGDTRRALLLGGSSVAPDTFALGMDRDREVMVVHHLVCPPATGGRPGRLPEARRRRRQPQAPQARPARSARP